MNVRCSTGECDEWVTVFGFPVASASHILTQFAQLGRLADQRLPGTGNWMHLRYHTPLHARKALALNGKVNTTRTPLTLDGKVNNTTCTALTLDYKVNNTRSALALNGNVNNTHTTITLNGKVNNTTRTALTFSGKVNNTTRRAVRASE